MDFWVGNFVSLREEIIVCFRSSDKKLHSIPHKVKFWISKDIFKNLEVGNMSAMLQACIHFAKSLWSLCQSTTRTNFLSYLLLLFLKCVLVPIWYVLLITDLRPETHLWSHRFHSLIFFWIHSFNSTPSMKTRSLAMRSPFTPLRKNFRCAMFPWNTSDISLKNLIVFSYI